MMLFQYTVTVKCITLFLILILQCGSRSTIAFTPSFLKVTPSSNNGRWASLTTTTGTTNEYIICHFSTNRRNRYNSHRLYMSDKCDNEANSKMVQTFFSPPPKPEDMIVLTGDLLSIATYGFLDHFLSKDLMSITVNHATTIEQLSSLVEKFASSSSLSSSTSSLLSTTTTAASIDTPVWIDSTITPNLSKIYQITASDIIVTHYSPLLQQTGLAVTLLASCWLLSGWYHEAFLYKNTLLCRTDNALIVTGKTWITCSILLFTLTSLSQYVCADCYTNFTLFSYTKGDIDFIIDSLSVLTMWRFLISYMLGTGR